MLYSTQISNYTVLLIVLASAVFVSARQIEEWSYDRLFREADLAVIVSAQATVDSTDIPPDKQWAESLVGQATTFKVTRTIKGDAVKDGDTMTLVHFRLKDGVTTSNGPLLVNFRTKPFKISVRGEQVDANVSMVEAPQYLLFLRKSAGGNFVPVSGWFDSALSVKEIYSPLLESAAKKP